MSAARIALLLCALLALLAPPCLAQNAAKGKTLAPPAEAAPVAPLPEPPPPPYEVQLMRLSEIMGTLAYMRELCGDRDGAEWSLRMKTLLDVEAKTEARRERLAGAYNRGFRGYELTYRVCTPAAHLVISRFLDEGGRLAHEISNRFSG